MKSAENRLRKPETRMLGSTLADIFNAPHYHCVMKGPRDRSEFGITRLQSGPRPVEKAPVYPSDEAILVCVSLTPTALDQWRGRYKRQDVGVTRAIAFATTMLDLRCPLVMWVRGPFDYLHYYLSLSLLRSVALENEVAAPQEFQEAFFVEDLVVAQLTRSILPSVKYGEPLDRLALDQVSQLLGAHILQRYCRSTKAATIAGRGLQTWQRVRAEEMLLAQLDGNITINEMASACSLSVSHFARSFRKSFGTSVHQYLIRLRIERARTLLSSTQIELAEIAHRSGFCDQAAFTRAFSQVERVTPSRWRKLNGTC
jgi:AraC family transcriptional regulator